MVQEIHRAYVVGRKVVSATGDHTIAAVPGRRLAITSMVLSTSVDELITLKQGSTTVGTLNLDAANADFVLPFNPDGWFITDVGATFVISPATGSTVVKGSLTYAEV